MVDIRCKKCHRFLGQADYGLQGGVMFYCNTCKSCNYALFTPNGILVTIKDGKKDKAQDFPELRKGVEPDTI